MGLYINLAIDIQSFNSLLKGPSMMACLRIRHFFDEGESRILQA